MLISGFKGLILAIPTHCVVISKNKGMEEEKIRFQMYFIDFALSSRFAFISEE